MLVLAGGLLYTLGALAHAFRRPDPRPAVFGFHEVFHMLVLAAVACQYSAVALFVLPEHMGEPAEPGLGDESCVFGSHR